VLDSYYLVTLGSYRFFYILNWLWRAISDHYFDPTSVIFGVIQTALYIDFAWVYYSRQRVKLRGGGVVDADDLSKSYLVRRIIGRGSRADNEDGDIAEEDEGLARQENGTIRPQAPRSGHSWGSRGISVSADDTLPAEDRGGSDAQRAGYADEAHQGDAQMIDPDQFEDDDEDMDAPPPPAKDNKFKDGNTSDGAEVGGSPWAEPDVRK
jgi:ER lumen protein retaining receptor